MSRVLSVDSAGELWGSERALLDLIAALPQGEIAVCCPPRTPLVSVLKDRGVAVFPSFVANLHRKSLGARALAALGVFYACLRARPEVLHINQAGAYRVVAPAAFLLSIPIIAHVRIFDDVDYLARPEIPRARLRGLVAISDAIEHALMAVPGLSGIPRRRIYDAFVGTAPPCAVPRPTRRRIACVGRIVPIKGQDTLVAALANVPVGLKPFECLFLGDGEDAYVRQLKDAVPPPLHDCVRWCGFVDDVPSVLRTCEFLVCPSHQEPLGRVIFEAWDAGLVPIAYAGSGGAAEVVGRAQGGLLYAEDTAEALAAAIGRAFALTAEERSAMVARGREWMARECAIERFGRVFEEVVSSAITAGPRLQAEVTARHARSSSPAQGRRR